MSNTLAALRGELDTILSGAGMHVADHMPERLNPPVAFLAAGSPYVESGDTYGTFAVRFTVVLVAPRAVNAASTAGLDRLVAAALTAVVEAPGWGAERVDQPSLLAANNTEYLSTTLDVITHRAIETEGAG